MVNEDSNEILITHNNNNNNLEQSPSLKWKIFHGIYSMLGGICLICGSCMYFADVIRYSSMALTAGGWFLTAGSFFLLLADFQQWWYDRINCCLDKKSQNLLQHSNSIKLNRLKNRKNAINSFLAACGSACYVIGSILLIPDFEKYANVGNKLIMIGSIIIFVSAIWKIYRNGSINIKDPSDRHFHLINIINDIPTLCTDICIGLGGAFYFFGVFFSPPNYDTNDFDINISAALCVTGGGFFFLASLFLQFQYYCKHHQ
ncbi:unnamed protein product [Adineta steineri]|uniref:YrhK domain-containing protein n=1 Tax=Adineta steineri TaxID=433720 RepID=A0A815B3M9_9BILA|nr:unnamed protein product [Adineta steineri]CAF1553420.1 unnamed protein product [Adineta steineri]